MNTENETSKDNFNPASCETAVSGCRSFRIGDIVYHRSVYEHKEPLKVVGITEDKLLLEGDYSGGTHNVVQRDWLPIKGTSRVHNHAFKLKARKDAIDIETLAKESLKFQHKNIQDRMIDFVLGFEEGFKKAMEINSKQ